MTWTDERIERLKEMWADGSTASQIAEELGGVSRNAVIGKAHRLGLEARPSPVKPGEEKEKKAAAPPRPRALQPKSPRPSPLPRRASGRAHRRQRPSCEPRGQARSAREHDPVSLGRPRRLHPPGSGRHAGADPAGAAAPPGPGQAQRRGRRQDQPARPQRPHLQMADGPSGRARFPFLRPAVEPRLSLLRRALRGRLSGAASAPRPPPAPAAALRRPAGALTKSENPGLTRRGFCWAAAKALCLPLSGPSPAKALPLLRFTPDMWLRSTRVASS